MSHKNKVVLLVVVGILALVQMACAGGPEFDAQVVDAVKSAPAQIQIGLEQANQTCFAGLVQGDTGKIVNGPCASPLP